MKKEEIKNIFEESLKNIDVSEELKEKTLNNIYNKNNVYHFPYWLKNCAAIFIVTCICLSIYLINNTPKAINGAEDKNLDTKNVSQDATFGEIQEESVNDSETFMLKSAMPISNYTNVESSIGESDKLRKNSYITMDYLENKALEKLTEEEFLINNPNAKKIDDGYLIFEKNEEIIYIFENGLLLKKIKK